MGDPHLDRVAAYHRLQDQALASAEYPPGRFEGRGIVICAGGPKYFTCAWVTINILRRVLRSTLPIQVWYLGEYELDAAMVELLRPLDVVCVDGTTVATARPFKRLGGWELKSLALAYCSFQEVVVIDADNVPVQDPAVLFDAAGYREHGAILWPDVRCLAPENAIWRLCRVAYREEPEIESGQLVIDKSRTWRALQATLHLNEHSDFYYRYIYGDKDTFRFGFRLAGQPYFSIPHPPRKIPGTLVQLDPGGEPMFQHRSGDKWNLWGGNVRSSQFVHEDACFAFLDELRDRWGGRVEPAIDVRSVEREIVARQVMFYRRVGHDERFLEFLPSHRIGAGHGACESVWYVTEQTGDLVLVLASETAVTCALRRSPDGVWRGRWLAHEQMAIEVLPSNDPCEVAAACTTRSPST